MFKRVLDYAGKWRKNTYAAMIFMLIGIVMNIVPYWVVYELIRKLLLRETITAGFALWRIAAMAVCGILYGFFM